MQPVAYRPHLGFGIGCLALRALVRGRVLPRGIRRTLGRRFDRRQRAFRVGATLLGCIEGALLPLHRQPERLRLRPGCLGSSSQRGEPHVVLGDQRTLRGDVGVERIELGARPDDVARGGGGGILRGTETRRDLVDLPTCVVDDGLGDGGPGVRLVAVVVEQRQTLAGERVQPAQSLLDTAEFERDGARPIDRLGALIVLELVDAATQAVGSVLQDQPLGVTLVLGSGVIRQLRSEA